MAEVTVNASMYFNKVELNKKTKPIFDKIHKEYGDICKQLFKLEKKSNRLIFPPDLFFTTRDINSNELTEVWLSFLENNCPWSFGANEFDEKFYALLYRLFGKGCSIEVSLWESNSGSSEDFEVTLTARGLKWDAIEEDDTDTDTDTDTGTDTGTALINAAKQGDTKTIALLLDKGADIEARDKDDGTALSWSAVKGHTEAVALLLDKGADIEEEDNGWRALHSAASAGHTEMVELLLDRGADIEAKIDDGRTALMIAADRGSAEAVALLLDKGADIEATNDEGKTALALAAEEDHKEIVKLLKNATSGKGGKKTPGKKKTTEQKKVKKR